MEYMWAPWRIEYVLADKPEGCFLCEKHKEKNDEENYVLFRGKKNYILLNSYPYNPGHLLVAPYRHIADPSKLTPVERNEHFELVCRGVEVLRAAFKPAGFNIGANLGKIAGAGVDDHFHSHIVPRWQGDTNCMAVISDVKVLPQALAETYQKLLGKFK
jgi:ATP adenylyltransferase